MFTIGPAMERYIRAARSQNMRTAILSILLVVVSSKQGGLNAFDLSLSPLIFKAHISKLAKEI